MAGVRDSALHAARTLGLNEGHDSLHCDHNRSHFPEFASCGAVRMGFTPVSGSLCEPRFHPCSGSRDVHARQGSLRNRALREPAPWHSARVRMDYHQVLVFCTNWLVATFASTWLQAHLPGTMPFLHARSLPDDQRNKITVELLSVVLAHRAGT
jgi:hypothetical protein